MTHIQKQKNRQESIKNNGYKKSTMYERGIIFTY